MALRIAALVLTLGLPTAAIAQERCLPIETGDGRRPVVMARVKGEGPFAFVLDTAASRTTIDGRTVTRLGLVRDPATGDAEGAGAAPRIRLFRAPAIEAGALSLSDAVVEEVPAPAFQSHEVVGLVGDDLIGNRLTVWRPGTGCVGLMASGGRPQGAADPDRDHHLPRWRPDHAGLDPALALDGFAPAEHPDAAHGDE